ncbi:MAG TPA: exodeoxyribonuclease VII large subunit [Acidimicrobiia bacterium]|nr:exodeoxyribonuclease VII large subunit [Acidimicrobiia bacterium]
MEQSSFDLDMTPAREPASPAAPEATAVEPDPTLSVTELTTGLRDAVRRSFPGDVWVRGEVQNLKRSQNGHTYFSLVEKAVGGRGDQVKAKIDVALFRDDRGPVDRAIKAVPGAELGNDVEVRIRGRVEVYAPQGRVQLRMTAIDPVFTVGSIAANRERVLRTLAAEGLLERNSRLPMPLLPLRIGLVTSANSAAYHDFVQELTASGLAFQVAPIDVRVQGANASGRIVYGLRQMAMRDLDVVVVVRGGGSRADLAPFDTDTVARTIAAMPVPVICGVGHEVDRSVADEVAHTICKTPTACAQVLVARVRRFQQRIDGASQRVVTRARARTAMANRELDEAARHVRRGVPAMLARERALVERRHGRIDELARLRLRDASRRLDDCSRRVGELGRARLREASTSLDNSATVVRTLDPVRVLERGYSITRDEAGRVVRRAAGTTVGSVLRTQLADGVVVSRVEGTAVDDDGGDD